MSSILFRSPSLLSLPSFFLQFLSRRSSFDEVRSIQIRFAPLRHCVIQMYCTNLNTNTSGIEAMLRTALSKWCENKAEFVQRVTISKHDARSIFAISSSDKDESLAESFVLGGRETSGSNRPTKHGLVNKDGETRPRNKFTTD